MQEAGLADKFDIDSCGTGTYNMERGGQPWKYSSSRACNQAIRRLASLTQQPASSRYALFQRARGKALQSPHMPLGCLTPCCGVAALCGFACNM